MSGFNGNMIEVNGAGEISAHRKYDEEASMMMGFTVETNPPIPKFYDCRVTDCGSHGVFAAGHAAASTQTRPSTHPGTKATPMLCFGIASWRGTEAVGP